VDQQQPTSTNIAFAQFELPLFLLCLGDSLPPIFSGCRSPQEAHLGEKGYTQHAMAPCNEPKGADFYNEGFGGNNAQNWF